MIQQSIIARSGTPLYIHLAKQTKTETTAQRHILLYYATWANNAGVFSAGLTRTADETGHSTATITRANADFRAAGILTWVKGYGNRSIEHAGVANAYAFNLPAFEKLPFIHISAPQPKKVTTPTAVRFEDDLLKQAESI